MVEAGPNSDVGQIDAAAIMAIRGLAALAEAAAHEGQEKAMEKIVDQLFRQCPTTSVSAFLPRSLTHRPNILAEA